MTFSLIAILVLYFRTASELRDCRHENEQLKSTPTATVTDLVRMSTMLAGETSPEPDWDRMGSVLHSGRLLDSDDVREVARARTFVTHADVDFDYAAMMGRSHAESLGLDGVSIKEDVHKIKVDAESIDLVYYGPVLIDQLDRLEVFEEWMIRDVMDDYPTSLRFYPDEIPDSYEVDRQD